MLKKIWSRRFAFHKTIGPAVHYIHAKAWDAVPIGANKTFCIPEDYSTGSQSEQSYLA